MKEKRDITRKQFLTGGATMLLGTVLAKLSGNSYAEETPKTDSSLPTVEKEWEQLSLDILSGAYLVSDPESALFGGTVEKPDCLLSQYFHVYPGLELILSDTNKGGEENGWVGYNKQLRPIAILRSGTKGKETEKRALVTVPDDVYYLRGSCGARAGQPCAWVKSFGQYLFNCGLSKPDLTAYTEITELTFSQNARKDTDGNFDTSQNRTPSMGDVFFTPIGTDIIVTFNNANIAPYIHSGENYMSLGSRRLFDRHYGFGYTWYHCKTVEVCSWLGACYETTNGCAKTLTLDELQAADPHLYIRFPSKATNTHQAAKIRTIGAKKNYQRLFTVVHLTDTHGDADSTHAAYEYADQIGADFVALTGDYVPYRTYHGYDILHSIMKGAKTPSVYSIGNHDVANNSDQHAYERNIAPIRDVLRASKEHPYYYRDLYYNGEAVRVISLYPFCEKAKLRDRGYYTQEQLLWLCETMATAPGGGHIFILRHFSHHKPILSREEETMFYDYGDSNTDFGDPWLNMRADPVAEIVDAYNERKMIFAQYTGDLKDGTETITVKYDFENRANSEFVAYFTGHVHVDHVGYARGTKTKQAVLGSLCTIGAKGSEEYSSYTSLSSPRDYGTDSQIAFNIFTFDFNNKKIYTARVGNNLFKDCEKTWMDLSYI